jgi:8-oxo-dGTP pyrophosphatase MutT (NUDIX family)
MSAKPPAPYPQSGVIPYRWHDQQLEILLITSRRRHRWVIPKGIIEPHLTSSTSACQEAYEEAGIRGEIFPQAIGTYTYTKWGYTWTVTVYLLAVHTILDIWPEMRSRERSWHPVQHAAGLVDEPALQALITSVPARIRGAG